MINKLGCSLGFSYCFGIGPIKFKALLDVFGDVEKAYFADKFSLEKIIGQKTAWRLVEFRRNFNQKNILAKLKTGGITVLSQEDNRYPNQLKNIPDPPICLYIKGKIDEINFNREKNFPFFAVVGTRKPTAYGQQIARMFVSQLASLGFVIVSGMAAGIDTIAHETTIESGSLTVAVLGCGVDIIYPSQNTYLYQKIVDGAGLVVSEFPPGHTVAPGLFIARNRIISGLSKGVMVIEGLKDSGSLITARFAVEQGREVFAPPSPLTSNMSQAPNSLIKQGAKLVMTVDDILEEFNLKIMPGRKKQPAIDLSNDEKIIFEKIAVEPQSCDELTLVTGLSINKVLDILSRLEIKGAVEKNCEGKYQSR